MAEHLRNLLAREGLVLRKGTVTTLSRFVEEVGAPGLAGLGVAPTAAELDGVIAETLVESCPEGFERVLDTAGLRPAIARALEELWLAEVELEQLGAFEGMAALADVGRRVEERLERRGLQPRGKQMTAAAEWLRENRVPGTETVLFDGFYSFARAEWRLLEALAGQHELLVAMADGVEGKRTSEWGHGKGFRVERVEGDWRKPLERVWEAGSREQEVLAIGRRVMALWEEGVELRRIGVVLRNPASYAGLIEIVFGQLGIPSRSYLAKGLGEHPLTGWARAVMAAVESGFEGEATLAALRWRLCGLGGAAAGDALELELREKLPAQGIGLFLDLKPELAAWADWTVAEYTAEEAVEQLRRLWVALEAPAGVGVDPYRAAAWRAMAEAREKLEAAWQETAEALPEGTKWSLPAFWREAEAAIAGYRLRERDTRRNVVHVMDAYESRQWELDFVFVPGMVEGEFPKVAAPEPMLPDEVRGGLGMKTLEERGKEERELFAVVGKRALRETIWSYPRTGEAGKATVASVFLGGLPGAERAGMLAMESAPARVSENAGVLGSGNYRGVRTWSATEFESYLQCPFQHFAAQGLRLEPLPALPAERLDVLVVGTAAHKAIERWTKEGGDLERLAEEELDRAVEKARAARGFQYELRRGELLRYLRLYARQALAVEAGWRVETEAAVEFAIDGVKVRGKIDRYDERDGVVRVYDYKYSRVEGLSEKYVQGGLYVLAMEARGLEVERFAYVSLKDEGKLRAMEGAELKQVITQVREDVQAVVSGVAAGVVAVRPKDRDQCEYCAYHEVCRIRTQAVAVEEEAAYGGEAVEE